MKDNMKRNINDEIKSADKIYDLIVENIEGLNTLSTVYFKLPTFEPKPSLLYELSKPLNSLFDLNIKLLQFGLLIDSIPKEKIDKLLRNRLKITSKELKEKYQRIGTKRVTKNSEIIFYKNLYGIENEEVVLIEVRNFSTIDSLDLLLNEVIEHFDKAIIKKLRLLRSFRNISELAHNIDPNLTQQKFKKLGFSHPIIESNLNDFWKVFLNHFLDILLRIKSSIQSELSKIRNEEILIFKSYFENSSFNIDDENRMIFEFKNIKNSSIYLNAYKVDFLLEDKFLIPFNWHFFGEIIKPRSEGLKKWGKVKPYNYYGIKKAGNWKMLSSIQFKFEDEISKRITGYISKFTVYD